MVKFTIKQELNLTKFKQNYSKIKDIENKLLEK